MSRFDRPPHRARFPVVLIVTLLSCNAYGTAYRTAVLAATLSRPSTPCLFPYGWAGGSIRACSEHPPQVVLDHRNPNRTQSRVIPGPSSTLMSSRVEC